MSTDELTAPAATSAPGVSIDPQRQELARAYAGQRRALMLARLALSAALVGVFLLSGASRGLRDALLAAGAGPPWLVVAAYVAVLIVASELASLPLGYYGGFVLPHRYGLSTQTAAGWASDQAKGLLLALVFGVPTAEVIYWLLRTQPATWWLWASAFMIAVTILMGQLAPVLIVPLFYKLSPLDNPDLVQRIRRLGEQARTRIVGVYTINLSARTTAGNAMVMGLGATKRIALGDTLYAQYTPDEIETIVAHELGHQVHRDLELGIAVESLSQLAGFYVAHLFLRWGVGYFGFDGPGDVAGLPLLAIALGIYSLITMPLANGYSRWREHLADLYALQITGKRAAFAAAMTRLANQNLAELDPPRWVVWLLYSHPPIKERIALAAPDTH